MGLFKTPRGATLVDNGHGKGIIWLQNGKTLTLDYVEPVPKTGADARKAVPREPAKITVTETARTAQKLTVTLSAASPVATVVDGIDGAGAVSGGLIVVAGDFENQPGIDVDLLADVVKGADADKIKLVQQLLFSQEENIFDQNNAANIRTHGELGCGKVVKASAEKLFGTVNPISYEQPYHEPLKKVTKRDDVRYRSSVIGKVRNIILDYLQKGSPVRVGVLDGPIGMHVTDGKLYAYYGGGHTVLIVGCNKAKTKFLYVDPWASGSVMKYGGGFAASRLDDPCQYIGIFEAEFASPRAVEMVTIEPNLLRQSSLSEGTFSAAKGNFLEVVSGPFVLR